MFINTEGGHQDNCSMKMQSGDGGKAARAEAVAKKTERAPIGTFFSVDVPGAELEAFQRAINEGLFAGDKQSQDVCEFEQPGEEGGSVQCSNVSPPGMTQKVVNHCTQCNRDQKKSVLRLCVLHGAVVWGGKHPHSTQIRMDL